MKKNIEDEKPEDLAPGKRGALVDRTGTCEFCRQIRIVKAYPDDPQSELDELAAEQCDCEMAEARQKAETSAYVVACKIDDHYGGLQKETKEAIKGCLLPVAAGQLKKVALTCEGGVSYSIFRKEGKLKFMRTVTDQEELGDE